MGYLVKPFRTVVGFGILRQKWRRHIEPIQPHLKRVNFLVPEPAIRCPGLAYQLGGQRMGSLFIAGVMKSGAQGE